MLSLRRWRAQHLLAAWVVYWLVLALAVLGRPLRALWHLRQLPDGAGNASVSLGDKGFDGTISVHGATVWHGHVALGVLVAWLVVPPIVLWIVWLATRPRPESVPPAALPGADPLADLRDRVRREEAGVRERRR
jgi:hypothetical protein